VEPWPATRPTWPAGLIKVGQEFETFSELLASLDYRVLDIVFLDEGVFRLVVYEYVIYRALDIPFLEFVR
jgi:hypothetical protein